LQPETPKKHFLDLTPAHWTQLMAEWGEPAFRAKQIVEWIFSRHARTPSAMSNLSASLRQRLASDLAWDFPDIHSNLRSADDATKLLLRGRNGQLIESVIMRYEGRTSLCVSSQVGCKLACSFCQTGKLGFFRHLATHEILAQYFLASEIVQQEGRRISHVVFMGMGEPLDNFEHVTQAVQMLVGKDTFGLSHRHVTISTSGIVPRIKELPSMVRAALAISLHAANDELRSELMPINRKYSLDDLKEALLAYQKATGDKITIEYILIRDKNCGIKDAKELVKFLHGLRAKVNLIPFNAHPGLPYERPDADAIRKFQSYLAERSIAAPVRYSKGLDVSGACGQLAAKVVATLGASPARRNVIAAPGSHRSSF